MLESALPLKCPARSPHLPMDPLFDRLTYSPVRLSFLHPQASFLWVQKEERVKGSCYSLNICAPTYSSYTENLSPV